MNIGDKIPLQSQTGNYSINEFAQAVVLNAAGVPILGSPFALTPDAKGFYSNNTAVMPNTPWVSVAIRFFQDSGFTIPSITNGGTDYDVALSLNPGQPLPIQSQTADYSTDQFAQATVLDAHGNPITGSPFTLTPDSLGFYSCSTAVMPNTPWVSVAVRFYSDSGFTSLSTTEGGTDYNVYLTLAGTGPSSFIKSVITAVLNGDICEDLPVQDVIVAGSDRTLQIRLQFPDGNPLDLSYCAQLVCRFRNADGTVLALSLTDIGNPIKILNPGGGQFSCDITKVQSALLATQTPAPFSIVVTTSQYGVTVINCPTQLAVEEPEV
jgi:hypothetical protein